MQWAPLPRLGVLGRVPAHEVEAEAAEAHVVLEPGQPLLERVAQVRVAVVQVPRTGPPRWRAAGGSAVSGRERDVERVIEVYIERHRET